MKQILVISGKGGTGKTFFTGCLAVYFKDKIIVDCDVDAANLHLILHPKIKEKHEFWSGKKAYIDQDNCSLCGTCKEICRFSAVIEENGIYTIDPYSCEGCTICSYMCPSEAIVLKDNLAGYYFISETKYGPFIHAELGIAQENSGKLVAKLREIAKNLAEKKNYKYVIIDGPPGVGCPVIASLTDVDIAIIITEPTLSGLHDLERVVELANHFKIPLKLIINKFNLNEEITSKIEKRANELKVQIIGKIPFSEDILNSVKFGIPFLEYVNSDTPLYQQIIQICKNVDT